MPEKRATKKDIMKAVTFLMFCSTYNTSLGDLQWSGFDLFNRINENIRPNTRTATWTPTEYGSILDGIVLLDYVLGQCTVGEDDTVDYLKVRVLPILGYWVLKSTQSFQTKQDRLLQDSIKLDNSGYSSMIKLH